MVVRTVNRKNTKDYSLTITEGENETPKNINGYTIYFTVKNNINDLTDDDVKAIISKSVVATSEVGLCTISLTTSDTSINPGSYMYDIKIKNPAGTWVKSSTPDKFIINGVVKNG